MVKDFIASMFSLMVGIFAIYMFFHATRDRFYNSKTYSQLKYITPLPIIFNFWFIKILFIVGGLLCIAVGIYFGFVEPFL
jgi:hypothetical protein